MGCLNKAIAQVADTTGFYKPVLMLTNENDYSITRYYRYQADTLANMPWQTAAASYNSGQFKTWLPNKVFNKGYTGVSSYWFAFTMKNVSGHYRQMFWSVANQVDSAILYTADSTGLVLKRTDTVRAFAPVEDRVVKVRRIAFSLELTPGEKQVYFMRVFYGSHKEWYLPMWFEQQMQVDTYRGIILGMYVGVYLFVILVSVLLFIFFKKKIYAWYAVYIFSFLFFVQIDEHLIIEFFHNTAFINYLYMVSPYPFIIYCLACNIKVMQLLCHQTGGNALMHKPANAVFYTNLIIGTLYLVSPFLFNAMGSRAMYSLATVSVNVIIPITLLVLLASVIEQVIKKNTIAAYYLIAVCCLFFGIINYYFNNLGITNFLIFRPNGLVVGTTVEILIISLLIGQDYRLLKKEKEALVIEKKNNELTNAFNIIQTQEAERHRIAQDLHDDIGATLSALKLHISQHDELENKMNEKDANHHRQALLLISKATEDLRSIAHDLLPYDFSHAGLFNSLQIRVQEFNQKSKTGFVLHLSGNEEYLSKSPTALAVYRIINELCVNIIRHAQAAIANIQLSLSANELQIIVEDDGVGMDYAVNKKGIGLKNTLARVEYLEGEINIDSNHHGTTIIITIPIKAD